MALVYLSGPIHECTDQECKEWRDRARYLLSRRSIKVIDPMKNDKRANYYTCDEAKLVLNDLRGIAMSSAMLVNPWKEGTGTPMEVVYAHQWGKPIVVLADKKRCSPWMRYHASVILPTLEECVAIIAYEILSAPR